MHADHQGDFQRLAGLFRHLEIVLGMARQQQHAKPVGAADLTAMDGNILDAGPRVAGNQKRRGDVRPAVELVVFWYRQVLEKIDVAVDHLVHRRGGDLDPRQRLARRALKTRQQRGRGDADKIGNPAAIGKKVGDDRHGVAARRRKQYGPFALELLRHGGKFVNQGKARPRHGEPVGDRQPL